MLLWNWCWRAFFLVKSVNVDFCSFVPLCDHAPLSYTELFKTCSALQWIINNHTYSAGMSLHNIVVKMVVFQFSQNFRQFSNPDSLSNSEAGVNPGIYKKLKNTLIWFSSMPEKPLVVSISQRMKSCNSTTWFRIWQSKTPALKALSSIAPPGWTVDFCGVMIGVLWKRE